MFVFSKLPKLWLVKNNIMDSWSKHCKSGFLLQKSIYSMSLSRVPLNSFVLNPKFSPANNSSEVRNPVAIWAPKSSKFEQISYWQLYEKYLEESSLDFIVPFKAKIIFWRVDPSETKAIISPWFKFIPKETYSNYFESWRLSCCFNANLTHFENVFKLFQPNSGCS